MILLNFLFFIARFWWHVYSKLFKGKSNARAKWKLKIKWWGLCALILKALTSWNALLFATTKARRILLHKCKKENAFTKTAAWTPLVNIAEHYTGIHEGMSSDFRTDKVLLNVTSLNFWKLPQITKMAFGASIKGGSVHWWCTKLIIFKINEVRFYSESFAVNGIVTRRWRVRVEVSCFSVSNSIPNELCWKKHNYPWQCKLVYQNG